MRSLEPDNLGPSLLLGLHTSIGPGGLWFSPSFFGGAGPGAMIPEAF